VKGTGFSPYVKLSNKTVGFSPWGMLFGLFARTQAFFLSLFSPYVNSSFR
jgi:hypothetical protein